MKLSLNSSASSIGSPISPVEVQDDSDELPLTKKCHVSKAEKRLPHFVDDFVKANKLTQCPAEQK